MDLTHNGIIWGRYPFEMNICIYYISHLLTYIWLYDVIYEKKKKMWFDIALDLLWF